MIVVVDASVAIKWFILEPDRAAARLLLEPGQRLLAPESHRGRGRKRKPVVASEADPRQVAATVASLPRFCGRLFTLAPLAACAMEIAAELRHPVYDCFYLALAEDENAVVVTADRRLIGRLAGSRWEQRCRPLVR